MSGACDMRMILESAGESGHNNVVLYWLANRYGRECAVLGSCGSRVLSVEDRSVLCSMCWQEDGKSEGQCVVG